MTTNESAMCDDFDIVYYHSKWNQRFKIIQKMQEKKEEEEVEEQRALPQLLICSK